VSALADVLLSPVERYVELLARWRPHRPVYHLPVASNLPAPPIDVPARPEPSDSVVLATLALGTNHLRLEDLAVQAADEAARRTGRDVTLLMLGADVPTLEGDHPGVRIVVPGELPAAELSRRLQSADLFLAPLADGVSARRTSVMAAMQHGLPIVGTAGPLTDGFLRHAGGLKLVPVEEPQRFATAAAELAASPELRSGLAVEIRRFYDAELDWPVMVSRLLGHLARHMPVSDAAHA
jgi:glycosyltransferase involved in cell wall biosynthesis